MACQPDEQGNTTPIVSEAGVYRTQTPDRSEVPLIAQTPEQIHDAAREWIHQIYEAGVEELKARGDFDMLKRFTSQRLATRMGTVTMYACINEMYHVSLKFTLCYDSLVHIVNCDTLCDSLFESQWPEICAQLCSIPYPPKRRTRNAVLTPYGPKVKSCWIVLGDSPWYEDACLTNKHNYQVYKDIMSECIPNFQQVGVCTSYMGTLQTFTKMLQIRAEELGIGFHRDAYGLECTEVTEPEDMFDDTEPPVALSTFIGVIAQFSLLGDLCSPAGN